VTSKKATEKRDASAEVNKRIRGQNRKAGDFEVVDWSGCDGALLQRVIAAVCKRSCAIQFGYTRDGGAYVIRIVGDGEPYNEYVRATEEIDVYLTGLALDFESSDNE